MKFAILIHLQTSSQLGWFVLAMVIYPDVQCRAQRELDMVVGQDRLPTFQDFDGLPYIRAIVKEILRWRGVTPLGTRPCLWHATSH
jgi:cytochrome P450